MANGKQWPAKYKAKDGAVVPSVTTILANLGWSTRGLTWWAFEQGKAAALRGENEATINDAREKLADAGTLCHLFAQCDITGKPRPAADPDDDPATWKTAEDNFGSYVAWKERTRLELVASEQRLVSEEYRFGGRLDAVAVFDGAAGILDFKSSKELYPDTVVQVAAYSHAWNEGHPDMPITHWHVLRWSPDGGFTHHSLSKAQVAAGWDAFLCALKLHNLKKFIKP